MAHIIVLVNPQTNTFVKTEVVHDTYKNAEGCVAWRNNKLSQKPNKKGLYWKVSQINV